MKKKRPIWTYIISFFNPIIPPFVIIVLCLSYILTVTFADDETGAKTVESIPFSEMYYPAIVTGLYACTAISLTYYFLVRKRKWQIRWWHNLLLIITGYSTIPVASIIIGHTENRIPQASSMLATHMAYVLYITAIAFFLITVLTKKKKIPTSTA